MDRNDKTWIEKQLNMMKRGIVTAEAGFNRAWNVLNVLTRVVQDIGVEKGWWKDQAEFQERFSKAAVDLYNEGKAHAKAEHDRIRSEQAQGIAPAPMVRKDLVSDLIDDANITIASQAEKESS